MNPETALAAPVETSPAIAPVIPLAVGRYAIPACDTLPGGKWEKLKQHDRDRINVLLDCFRQMEAAPSLVKECDALAFRFRGVRGFSAGSIRNLYYAWKENGWHALCHGYSANKPKLPPEFVEFWRALCEQHGRSILTAKEELFRAWFAGRPIPGDGDIVPAGAVVDQVLEIGGKLIKYRATAGQRCAGTWLDWWHRHNPTEEAPKLCPDTPEGWSKTTLYEAGPDKITRRWATRGLAAVKPLLPSLIRDTSKLLPLQLVTMDDFETDQRAYAKNPRTGEWQLVKVTGIAVMDVATRRVIAILMKPRFTDEAGKEEAITRAEVRLLFFQVLRDYGIPSCGMTWLVENAAAAITSELELTVRNLFGGRVQVTRTGLIHDKVFSNGFIERGGKPQQKGWIESRFNLLHNRADGLPGQKGANYMVKPGDLAAKEQYAEHLIGQGRDDAKLTDEQIGRLRMPFKSADELIAFYMSELFPALDRRIEHKMIGFDPLHRWRRDEHDTWHEWEELATVPESEWESLQWFPRELRESPRMRWDRLIGKVQCERVPQHVLMMLLLTPKQVKMRKTGVTLVHNGKGYSFADKRAIELRIPEGTDVLCYFDPARPGNVHVCDMEGRYLVELRSLSVDITDAAAMDDASAHISALYHTILAGIRGRPLHQAADAQQLADREHNAAIEAEGRPALPAPAEPKPAASVSPVRRYVAKRGVTAVLARDAFAPGPVTTPAGEATAQAMIASAAEAADAAKTSATLASVEIDSSDLL